MNPQPQLTVRTTWARFRCLLQLFLVKVLLIALIASNSGFAAESVSFENDVRPVLNRYCVGCHTQEDPEGGYVMETYQQLMKGGEHGTAITPGVTDSSRLLLMLQAKLQPSMPPEGEPRPTESEIETLVKWIEQGAVGPQGAPSLKAEPITPNIDRNSQVTLPITAIAKHRGNDLIALGRYGEISITDPSGKVVTQISDELHKINSLQFSKDGKRLLVASGQTGAYGLAAIYSVDNGEQLLELVGHRDVLYSAVFSPDESIIATAGYDREIILWDSRTGEAIRQLSGHNGAIFSLSFTPDGSRLVSACADETLKIWDVASGRRIDTLGQPEGEVIALLLSHDGRFVIAGGADNRVRVWELGVDGQVQRNPLIATRYVDDSAITHLQFTNDAQAIAVTTAAGNIKMLDTNSWSLFATLDAIEDTATAIIADNKRQELFLCLMNGKMVQRPIPATPPRRATVADSEAQKIYLDLGTATSLKEADLQTQTATLPFVAIPRHSQITGSISASNEVDLYRWAAKKNEQWAIDVDATKDSPLDPIVTVLDQDMNPVLRTRLQATRESYFTFRGKDSTQVGDFRLFNWEEMHLNDFLYSSGEVTRLWLYPRGPDSGYNVYPNEGQRWSYFGTSHTTHALGEPAYIVRPLLNQEIPPDNGLPTFDVYYENDDDPRRIAGKNSRLIFSAPSDGNYFIQITDTRGMGGETYQYQATVRPSSPSFIPTLSKANGKIHRGTGREFTVRVDRIDGYDGEVTFDITNLPKAFVTNLPLTIESGQRFATGCLWLPSDAEPWEGTLSPELIASATILGKQVERSLGSVGELTLEDRPNAVPTIHPIDREVATNERWTLQVRRGETVTARVMVDRKEGFTAEISFGKEDAGRNSTHGVYVDNIGLNGLLVRQNESVREFFITADPIAALGKRDFHLRAATDGGVTSHPIVLEVLP